MVRVLVVGGSGTIGRQVVAAVREAIPGVEVLIGGRGQSDVKIDITNATSVHEALLSLAGNPVDHLVVAAGDALFKPVSNATREEVEGKFSKYFGQVDVVLQAGATGAVKDGGSITLTSGCLDVFSIPAGAFASSVNSAVNAFVRSGANEVPRNIRLNVVSPGLLTESVPVYGPYFAGFVPVEGRVVGLTYVRAMLGNIRGKVIVINGAPSFAEL